MDEAKLCFTVNALNLQESKSEINLALDALQQINFKQERDYLFFLNCIVKYLYFFEEARDIKKIF